MPIKHAAFKALRKSEKNRAFNVKVSTEFKTLLRDARQLIANKKLEEAKKKVQQTVKALDKAARKKVIKKNTAARLKSRLARALNAANK